MSEAPANFCSNCGAHLEPDAHFCPVCGHARVGDAAAAAEPPPPPPPGTAPEAAAPASARNPLLIVVGVLAAVVLVASLVVIAIVLWPDSGGSNPPGTITTSSITTSTSSSSTSTTSSSSTTTTTSPPAVGTGDAGATAIGIVQQGVSQCGQGGTLGAYSTIETTALVYRVSVPVTFEGFEDQPPVTVSWIVDLNAANPQPVPQDQGAAELICQG